jgi:hypothetical protein
LRRTNILKALAILQVPYSQALAPQKNAYPNTKTRALKTHATLTVKSASARKTMNTNANRTNWIRLFGAEEICPNHRDPLFHKIAKPFAWSAWSAVKNNFSAQNRPQSESAIGNERLTSELK